MSMIEIEFATRLGALVSGRAYPVVMPQDVVFPAITFHRLDTQKTKETFGLGDVQLSDADAEKATFQIVIWGKTYKPLAELLRSVRTALEPLNQLQFEGVQDGWESQKNLYSIIIDCAIWGDLDADRGAITAPALTPLNNYEAAIVGTLATLLPLVDVAPHNPVERRYTDLPALRVRIGRGSDLELFGDGRLRMLVDVSLHCLHAANQPWARELAMQVASIVGVDQQWGVFAAAGFPERVEFSEAARNPGQHGFDHWVVSFQQRLTINALPVDASTVPTNILLSMSPDIGIPNEPEYHPV